VGKIKNINIEKANDKTSEKPNTMFVVFSLNLLVTHLSNFDCCSSSSKKDAE